MERIFKKLISRKLWLAAAGLATGIAMVFGIEEQAVSTVSGAVTAVVSVVTYILTEGRVDAASAKSAVDSVRNAAGTFELKENK